MTRFLYDTAIFVYAVGGEHPYREPCRDIIARAGRRELRGEASADLLQEFVHQRLRRGVGRERAIAQGRDVAGLCRLHDVTAVDALAALSVLEDHPGLTPRDATFVALAAARGIGAILTPDRDFDGVHGLRRVDPLDDEAVAWLAAA